MAGGNKTTFLPFSLLLRAKKASLEATLQTLSYVSFPKIGSYDFF